MDEQNDKDRPQSRVKKSSNTLLYIAITTVVLFVIGFYFYLQKSPSTSPIDHAEPTVVAPEPQSPEQVAPQPPQPTTKMEDKLTDQESAQPEEDAPYWDVEVRIKEQPTTKDTSGEIQQPLSPEDNPQQLIGEINSFYVHLDQQPYMQKYGLKEKSKVHFSKLLQKIVDNPPVVIRETDDLFTLLQNTAHFFRILGKENINIFKGILDKERNSFEQILQAFYALTYHPEYLKKEYSLTIPPGVLTDYAGFFLNTMGGRLYLFRRDSALRNVVSYYAIITIDRANKAGDGGHGIDLRPPIRSLVEEIENGGRRLQLKEKYLDALYDLQEKYN